MKVLLLSDTHIGITSKSAIKEMLCAIKNQVKGIEVIVHTGDYSGGYVGSKAVEQTCKLITSYFTDIPIITTIGNHDYWCGSPSKTTTPVKFKNNYDRITSCFRDYNIHFIDEDGLRVVNDAVFVGSSGWYSNPYPPTNDKYYIPSSIDGGSANDYILTKVENSLDKQLKELDSIYTEETKVVFVSHFAVIPDLNDYKGAFKTFGWSEHVANIMKTEYNCKYFLQGHSHHRKTGPEVFEAGSDYYKPNYLIINL